MSESELIPALMLFTLIAALVIAIVLFLRFRRKPENRHPMRGEEERNIGDAIDQAENGPRV